jgi:hypothetical protein
VEEARLIFNVLVTLAEPSPAAATQVGPLTSCWPLATRVCLASSVWSSCVLPACVSWLHLPRQLAFVLLCAGGAAGDGRLCAPL